MTKRNTKRPAKKTARTVGSSTGGIEILAENARSPYEYGLAVAESNTTVSHDDILRIGTSRFGNANLVEIAVRRGAEVIRALGGSR